MSFNLAYHISSDVVDKFLLLKFLTRSWIENSTVCPVETVEFEEKNTLLFLDNCVRRSIAGKEQSSIEKHLQEYCYWKSLTSRNTK